MSTERKYYPPNMFRICVDENEEHVAGRAISPLTKKEICFEDYAGLLLEMDKLFDEVGYPQAFQKKRSFVATSGNNNAYRGIPEMILTKEEILSQKGKKATYDVLVVSRRNTTWQGQVFDEDNNRVGSFIGDVDLIEILNRLQK